MSTDDFLKQYASALAAQSAASDVVKVMEMRAKLFSARPQTSDEPSETDQYIASQGGWLTDEDIEFLSQKNRSTGEVAKRLDDVSTNTVKRLCEAGQLEYTKSEKGRYRISTVSVMKCLDGQTEEKK